MTRIERREPTAGHEHWRWPDGTHRVLRQVLSRRPIESPEDLKLELGRIVPIGELAALDAAVSLLVRHRHDRIVVVGDFDADGATSAALMVLCLRAFGFGDVDYFIPDRFVMGYGLTPAVIERLRADAPDLIVTVDNGISSVAGVDAARALGSDVLITDHHLPPRRLPAADVIVNPNLPDHGLGGRHLAGVGVAFYVLAALGKALGQPRRAAEFLDLVAFGTLADLVPLDRTNRILIGQGLGRIRAGRCRPGIRALCRAAGIAPERLGDTDLAYQLAPRLNAAGRLDDMTIGVRCLVTDSEREAQSLAQTLDGLNRERRTLEQQMRVEAEAAIDAEQLGDGGALPEVVCLFRDGWHEGVVGLVASRIKERHHRPVFAFATTDGDRLKGSGRSVPGFHLRDALAAVDAMHPGLIERFGGHAMAAGLTLSHEALPAFERAIVDFGREQLAPELLTGRILTDGALEPADLTGEVAGLLRDAGPWGQGFPEPRFDGRFEVLGTRVLKDAHTKLKLRPSEGRHCVDAIAFNQLGTWPESTELRVVYRLAINEYFGRPDLQLIVEHIETARS